MRGQPVRHPSPRGQARPGQPGRQQADTRRELRGAKRARTRHESAGSRCRAERQRGKREGGVGESKGQGGTEGKKSRWGDRDDRNQDQRRAEQGASRASQGRRKTGENGPEGARRPERRAGNRGTNGADQRNAPGSGMSKEGEAEAGSCWRKPAACAGRWPTGRSDGAPSAGR